MSAILAMHEAWAASSNTELWNNYTKHFTRSPLRRGAPLLLNSAMAGSTRRRPWEQTRCSSAVITTARCIRQWSSQFARWLWETNHGGLGHGPEAGGHEFASQRFGISFLSLDENVAMIGIADLHLYYLKKRWQRAPDTF